MQKLKIIIEIVLQIILCFFSYHLFILFFNTISEIKYWYLVLFLFIIFTKNIDNIILLFKKEEKEDDSLFNVYYINYSKTFEICMLIDNKIQSKIEKSYKDESIEKNSSSLFGESSKAPFKIGANISEENSNTKTYEYKELQEIKNTNSTFLRLLRKKCKNINLSNLKNGDLVKIDDAQLEIINKDEIAQVNSMVSGIFNGNVIPTDSEGQTFNINVSAITNILLKDYKYQLMCKTGALNEFYISIPMKANKEFESDYSIYDLEIGKVDIIGIYRTDKYNYKKNTNTFNYLQEIGVNSKESNIDGDELINSETPRVKPKKTSSFSDMPYIDLIAIIQDLDIKKENVNE